MPLSQELPPLSSAEPDIVPSILMVDDHAANLLALEAILEPLGHRLVRAHSGEEALKRLLTEEFAVILLDVQMPGLDGFETASLIKSHKRTSSIPIIFITAISRDAAHVFRGYSKGAVDYLLKPFDPDILRSKVSVFVDLFRKGEKIKAQAKLLRERELEALTRQSEQRYRRLTESMPIPLWGARPDGTIYYCNRSWTEYSGLRAEDCEELADPRVVHPDDVAEVRAAWASSIDMEAPFEVEYRLRRKDDGAYRWHLSRALPERDDTGHVEGWIVTATDIDEKKQVEAARLELLDRERRAREVAEAANRTKDEFLAMVSHELRTPLHAILGWAGMLRGGMLDPAKTNRALETIERNAQVQSELIEDLLDVSRIISGKLRLDIRRMKLGSVVAAAVETVGPAAAAKGVHLEHTSTADADVITGDPDRLQQVVWNLVSNAVKFTPKGGRVEVSVERIDSEMRVRVADTGTGIGPDLLPYVFDRFWQADNSMTRTHQGLGLGLAIVRHLVELHGGHVRAESCGPGAGSEFVVTLPIRLMHVSDHDVEAPPVAPRPSTPPPDDHRLDGVTVLFVDDQRDARDLFTEVFEQRGARVITAGSATDALAAVESSPPDVLVSDIGLPGEDGYALIRKVRTLEPARGGRVPAVAVTAHARAEDGSRALAEGFQMHLAKPVEPTTLVALVASLAEAGKR